MQQFSADKLSLDHVVPRARGGKLVWTNTVTACFECNFKKGMCVVLAHIYTYYTCNITCAYICIY